MKTNKEYFEGWYLKNTNEQETISFIPGICSNLEKKEAFIQIITKGDSWYVPYKITEFQYNDKPFEIKIGNNFFSNNEIEINIHNEQVDIEGKLKYENKTPIQIEGLIGNLIIEGKEYRFATYNGSKIIKNDINGENVNIILQRSHLTLEIIAKSNQSKPLKAPKQGKMKNHIQESIQAEIEIILKYKDKLMYQDKSYCAGLEVIK